MRRVFVMFVAGLFAAPAALPAIAAGPPDRFEADITLQFFDAANELVLFFNTDRASYCTDDVVAWENQLIDWVEGGEVGEPPDEPAFPGGFDLASIQVVETGQGAIVVLAVGRDFFIELWHADSLSNRGNVGPCTDTDDDAAFFAAGTASWQFQSNDASDGGTRTGVFKTDIKADVTDVFGTDYKYTYFFHINTQCPVDVDGSPTCAVERYVVLAPIS